MSEHLQSRILLLNAGDRLIVDRADKPGVVEFRATTPGLVEFQIAEETHRVELIPEELTKAHFAHDFDTIFGDSPVMFLISPSENTNATIESPQSYN